MINRAALIVRYKQPFLDWINAVDPGTSRALTMEDAELEKTVYLLEVEDEAELQRWLEVNHEVLFEDELFGWYTDPELWPKDRSLKTFMQWCTLELNTVVIDTGESLIVEEEF